MIKRSHDMHKETRSSMRGGKGDVHLQHYFKKEEIKAPCRLCAELVLPPGSEIGLHEHSGEDELYIIQKGSGIIVDGADTFEIKAGDAVITGDGAYHSIKNTGNEDLVVTAIIIQYPEKGQ